MEDTEMTVARAARVVELAEVAFKEAAERQFNAAALTKHLECRVDDIELERLAEAGALEVVAKYVYQVRGEQHFRAWIAAKLDQRERNLEPPPRREPDPEPDEKLVLPLADAILKYLGEVPEEQRELVLRAALVRVTQPPPMPPEEVPLAEEVPLEEIIRPR